MLLYIHATADAIEGEGRVVELISCLWKDIRILLVCNVWEDLDPLCMKMQDKVSR